MPASVLIAWITSIGESTPTPDTLLATVAARAGVPEHLARLVMLIEDKRFWLHPGADPIAIARACYMNARGRGRKQGGSTIPEQLVKMRTGKHNSTLARRFTRALSAMRVVACTAKDELLAEYLTSVYLGQHAHGVGQAALQYFDKSAALLTVPESFFLAERIALPNAFRPARIRNLLSRPLVRSALGAAIREVPAAYERALGASAAVAVASTVDHILGESNAR